MNYHHLLDLATELGYRLAMCGAETFRVEESIRRVLLSYGIESEVFAIPNCLHVSIQTAKGVPMTRMRRIGYHGNDMEGVERYNALSRKICAQTPDPDVAFEWMAQTQAACRSYRLPLYLTGHFVGSFGFSLFFGSAPLDAFWSGICGLLVGLVCLAMDRMKTNQFFSTIASAYLASLLAYAVGYLGLTPNADGAVIGSLMYLVPGLLFTNSMRDIIYGDTNSGINRLVQVLLIAGAIALGTAAAWRTAEALWATPVVSALELYHPLIQVAVSFVGCMGFAILFNIHGFGILLCAIGGLLTWAVYLVAVEFGCTEVISIFYASLFASVYSETMARIRKYPAISYLVVSAFPLLPGAGLYYTMSFAVQGDMVAFAAKGGQTLSIACAMAVGILLGSTVFRLYSSLRHRIKHSK